MFCLPNVAVPGQTRDRHAATAAACHARASRDVFQKSLGSENVRQDNAESQTARKLRVSADQPEEISSNGNADAKCQDTWKEVRVGMGMVAAWSW